MWRIKHISYWQVVKAELASKIVDLLLAKKVAATQEETRARSLQWI
jgi:hypothetical protein|tara:strand:- start:288 stop:425 length:138 start_codon:yes stop_codon:yes gene_type:complete